MTDDTTDSLTIGRVTLVVHDLAGVAEFYADEIGLQPQSVGADSILLCAGDRALLELRQDREARRSTSREPGLFHTAFLLPTRADLGRWVGHVTTRGVPLQGASDHLVSEAVYLADPEGNGIEVYADRPRASWAWHDGTVRMATDPLDVDNLVRSGGDQPWQGAPAGTAVGHLHLQVGAIPEAEAFYARVLGLDVTSRYPGGTFYGWGGYHHHFATNVWNSRGAGPRVEPSTGLADVSVVARDLAGVRTRIGESQHLVETESGFSIRDPWGTSISFVAASFVAASFVVASFVAA